MSRQYKPDCTSSLQPSRHQEVAELLEENNLRFGFHNVDDDNCFKDYDTNIMGRFVCRNNRCATNGWGSKKIAVTIRLYHGKKYNALVYHQRCRDCNAVSQPILDDTYAERVAYRLKKWSGIHMERPQHKKGNKKPHLSSLCEGCKAGHCSDLLD